MRPSRSPRPARHATARSSWPPVRAGTAARSAPRPPRPGVRDSLASHGPAASSCPDGYVSSGPSTASSISGSASLVTSVAVGATGAAVVAAGGEGRVLAVLAAAAGTAAAGAGGGLAVVAAPICVASVARTGISWLSWAMIDVPGSAVSRAAGCRVPTATGDEAMAGRVGGLDAEAGGEPAAPGGAGPGGRGC
jgi:hypothetical protein